LLRDALQLSEQERHELASRLLAQESSVVSADPTVMSGAPVFKGTRVLVQTLIEHFEAGDSIDDFLEGFPSVTREQVIAFLEETNSRAGLRRMRILVDECVDWRRERENCRY
jgi:uncharacterized protein (DUF433 family)